MSKLFKTLGRPFKPFLNVSSFLGYKELKGSYKNLTGMAKEAVSRPEQSERVDESFEAAVARLNLNEEDMAAKKKNYHTFSIAYLAMAVLMFVYMLYLFFTGVFLGVFIAAVLVLVALAYSYREHFWYTQMHYRRLGLTFKDWQAYTFGGRKK